MDDEDGDGDDGRDDDGSWWGGSGRCGGEALAGASGNTRMYLGGITKATKTRHPSIRQLSSACSERIKTA